MNRDILSRRIAEIVDFRRTVRQRDRICLVKLAKAERSAYIFLFEIIQSDGLIAILRTNCEGLSYFSAEKIEQQQLLRFYRDIISQFIEKRNCD